MRDQTIKIVTEPGADGISATVDAVEAERLLALFAASGGQFELGLAPESDDDVEGHLFGAGAIVRLVVRRPDGDEDDVEGHALTLRFPSAEEASKFKTKVLAGGLLVGTLIAPAAGLAGGQAAAANLGDAGSGGGPAATTQVQSYAWHGGDLQIVVPDDGSGSGGGGSSVGSGENNKMGSAIAWTTRTDSSR